ncbi:MAG TPA: lysophospholipid acyltransferase family protein [Steroidobacteraceae bacterium]|nr:lysophospholipid acyltransferase family protein [Steroidobacteraceae bacterium]
MVKDALASPEGSAPERSAPEARPERAAWWVRLAAALPWPVLHGLAGLLAWMAERVGYARRIIDEHLATAFPELTPRERAQIRRRYYRGFAQVLIEVVKATALSAAQLRARIEIAGVAAVRERLAAGPVLLVAAHQCNWEWMLLGLSLELGFPLDAAYKPLVDSWAQREMLKLRTRFGGRLVPAQELLVDIIRRGRAPRAICMVADQEPRTSERKHWTRFLNRDTAFFMGTEEIARVTRFPVFFVGMRRIARSRYALEIEPLADAGEVGPAGELTERYVQRVERQIRESPPDWPWSHKRWKLKKSLYGRE